MPSSVVVKLMEEVATLKAQVASLIRFHQWQMGILAAILIAIVLRKI